MMGPMTDAEPRVLVVGEALVDVVPDRDGNPQDLPGGSPANVAITLGRLGRDVRLSIPGTTVVHDVVLGLGGRPVTRAGLRDLVLDVLADRVPDQTLHFADLDRVAVERELSREAAFETAIQTEVSP